MYRVSFSITKNKWLLCGRCFAFFAGLYKQHSNEVVFNILIEMANFEVLKLRNVCNKKSIGKLLTSITTHVLLCSREEMGCGNEGFLLHVIKLT
jgi:hypothetical protein